MSGDRESIVTVDRWHIMPRSYHLPPPDPDEDQPVADLPTEEQPPPAMHTEEHQVPASSVPAPLPTAPAFSTRPEPSAPSPIASADVTASAVYHYFQPGLSDHHGCSPHILLHNSIICDYPYDPCGEDDSH